MQKIYPVKNVKVRKIKVLQRPNIDFQKLTEMHNPEHRGLKDESKKGKGKKEEKAQNVIQAENLVDKV